MIEFSSFLDIPDNFTGVCKLICNMSIRYYKNDNLHREDGPAIEYPNGEKYWFINGLSHREDGPTVEFADGRKSWHYKDKFYGINDDFTNETWKEKVEELIRKEKLKIFK